MADYDKVYVITAKLRDSMIKELEGRKTRRVLKTLKGMSPCYPTRMVVR